MKSFFLNYQLTPIKVLDFGDPIVDSDEFYNREMMHWRKIVREGNRAMVLNIRETDIQK